MISTSWVLTIFAFWSPCLWLWYVTSLTDIGNIFHMALSSIPLFNRQSRRHPASCPKSVFSTMSWSQVPENQCCYYNVLVSSSGNKEIANTIVHHKKINVPPRASISYVTRLGTDPRGLLSMWETSGSPGINIICGEGETEIQEPSWHLPGSSTSYCHQSPL